MKKIDPSFTMSKAQIENLEDLFKEFVAPQTDVKLAKHNTMVLNVKKTHAGKDIDELTDPSEKLAHELLRVHAFELETNIRKLIE